MIHRITRAWRRIAADVSPRSHFDAYRTFLEEAIDRGYQIVSLDTWISLLREGRCPERFVALRHDVDIDDVDGNTAFFEIERELGARSTFFFRLSTMHPHRQLIDALLNESFDVGYHYEELSTHAKQHGWSGRDLDKVLPEVRSTFRANCERFRSEANPELTAVAAHGDWMNRRLGIANTALIDRSLLDECGLRFEAYDPELTEAADLYLTDTRQPPQSWTNENEWVATLGSSDHIYALAHDRIWSGNVPPKIAATLHRVGDVMRYQIRHGRRS